MTHRSSAGGNAAEGAIDQFRLCLQERIAANGGNFEHKLAWQSKFALDLSAW